MSDFSLILPNDFDEYAWEVEAKGWFSDVMVNIAGKVYKLNFYDPARLNQEIEDDFSGNVAFVGGNLVVVRAVNRANIEIAVSDLVRSNRIYALASEQ